MAWAVVEPWGEGVSPGGDFEGGSGVPERGEGGPEGRAKPLGCEGRTRAEGKAGGSESEAREGRRSRREGRAKSLRGGQGVAGDISPLSPESSREGRGFIPSVLPGCCWPPCLPTVGSQAMLLIWGEPNGDGSKDDPEVSSSPEVTPGILGVD